MQTKPLTLAVLPDRFGICRLDAVAQVPAWAYQSTFFSVTRTPYELSVVCAEECIPEDLLCDNGWKCLEVQGPLDLSATGILASLSLALTHAGISIFVVSTYDTDYLLVKEENLAKAIQALAAEGHMVLDL
jgi:hypothetical protein